MNAKAVTLSIQLIRQKLESAKANYKGDPAAFDKDVDSFITSLRAKHGDQVTAVQLHRSIREPGFPIEEFFAAFEDPGAAATAPNDGKKIPDGVTVQSTMGGFLLRAKSQGLLSGLVFAVFAAVLCAAPFVAFPDLISSIRNSEGLSFWLGSAFVTAWTCGALYALMLGALSMFGEVRIMKEGDSGEIFTGIAKLGRTHRVRWSEFYGAGDRAVSTSSSGRLTHTVHYVGLNGKSSSYKFGSDLNEEQQAFVIAYLREHALDLPLAA